MLEFLTMLNFLHNIDIMQLTKTAGTIGLVAIIFCETGIFLGCFLPGDSLLFTAGLLAAQGVFHIWLLTPLLIAAAFLGYAIAYWLGEKIGHWLMKRPDRFWFKKAYLTQTHEFYGKHGGKAMILGRFVPIVRTFLPIIAGLADMPIRRYMLYNLIGAVIWAGGVVLLGYYLGSLIPNAEHYILPMVLIIIVLSILPPAIHIWRARRKTVKSDS